MAALGLDGLGELRDDPREHAREAIREYVRFGGSLGAGLDEPLLPHFYYVLAGAASLLFAVAPECRRLTGLDPATPEAVETHADLVARLLVP